MLSDCDSRIGARESGRGMSSPSAVQRPRIAVSGPSGFVAWHVRCAARARWGGDLIGLGRREFADPDLMDAKISSADAVIHLAGVNRARRDGEIERVNPWLAERLVESLKRSERQIPVVYGNSIHSLGDSVFGTSKLRAADVLRSWSVASGAAFVDVVMPNIFGEHGVPHYNSVIATFSSLLARGELPSLFDDKELPLAHVVGIADLLLDQALSPEPGVVTPPNRRVLVSDVLTELQQIAADYRAGVLPDLADPFTRQLFNTYRAAAFPGQWPLYPQVNSDTRGDLVEAVKSRGGQTQAFYSSTKVGHTRGQHWHRSKLERFVVLDGSAVIRVRKLFTDELVEFAVNGEVPAIVDMPTFHVHSITNTGSKELLALFYADEMFDPSRPDTYPEVV